MKFDVYKCDWCKEEVRVPKGESMANGPWIERDGTIPTQMRDDDKNIKRVEPVKQSITFCSSKCNASQKDTEAEALKAANEAWLTVYNRKAP